MKRLVVALLCATLSVWTNAADPKDLNKIFENPLANGYGEDINWVKWEDAIEVREENSLIIGIR
jgi:hypothetical protein